MSSLQSPESPKTSTIPYTPTSPGWTSVHPRPLRAILPYPDIDKVETPALPSPPRPPVFHTTTHGVWRLSTHLVPAAYPRLVPDIPLPEIPTYTPSGSHNARRDKMDTLVEGVLKTQTAYEQGRHVGEPSTRLLWNCLNRFVRTSARTAVAPARRSGVTLFLVHANGLHKETWETMLREVLDAPGGDMIEEVWAWEAVQHGDAAILNTENLSGIFDWLDNARDIANFLLHYLPEDVKSQVLPVRLPRLPAPVASYREERGYRTRKLVVIGHSFGGCTSLRVAFDFPRLFSSFVLVDPVILRPDGYLPGFIHQKVLGAFSRRERWSSREEALQLLQKSPFFGAWDPDVLQLYVDYGLIDDAEEGVRLKMSGLREGLSFANRVTSFETWVLLERLDERITLRWVVPEHPLSTTEAMNERVWRRPVNSANVVFHSAGHLIVQESPFELAHDVSHFLLRTYGTTKAQL